MLIRRVAVAVAVATLATGLALPVTASASTTLLKDGGFEKPAVAAGSYQLFSTGQALANWSVVGASGNVGVVSGSFTQGGFSFPAKRGQQWLDLTGTSNTATGVAQTVSTTPATSHTLSFAIGNVYDPTGIFGVSSTVHVFVNGVQVATATNAKRPTSNSMAWQTFHVTFTATAANTTVEVINADPANDTVNGLDAVSLT